MRTIISYKHRKDPKTGEFSTKPQYRVVVKPEIPEEVGQTVEVHLAKDKAVQVKCGDPAQWFK